ncbi:hypothetical protein D3C81_1829010 [compost metagenome]
MYLLLLRPSGLKLKLLRISRRLSGVRRTVVPNGSAGITPQNGLPPRRACSSLLSGRVMLA